ncbi:MAG TPA: AMP-binding protein [Burkholderiaceae bacterium]|nr:AMP-binding protein [Burkholderiaceae bacterium]
MTATLRFGDDTLSPDRLLPRVRRVAGGLLALGVRDEDVVALVLRNEPAAIEITLACNLIGAYHCPINFHFREQELGYILADSGATVLFIHADLLPALAGAIPSACRVVRVEPSALTRAAHRLPPRAAADGAGGAGGADGADTVATTRNADAAADAIDPDDARQPGSIRAASPPEYEYEAWLGAQTPYDGPPHVAPGRFAYTSGTTGRPKGVRRLRETLHPEQPRLLAEVARASFGFEPGARVLLPAPLYHGAPNLYAIQAMQLAERLVLLPRFDAGATLRTIESERITHAYLVPTMCVRLLALPEAVRRRHDLSSLRFVTATGSPFAPDVKRAMIGWLGPVIREAYASSELGVTTLIDAHEWLARPGSVGRPLGQAQVRIVDDEGRELPAGRIGNIHARQPAYADFTYHRLPDARRAIDHGGLACVGDIGYLDADGYLYICDRKSDMVISGGVNIYPAEIEAALATMPGVADSVAFGVPDAEYGETVLAIVQPEPEAALDEATVLNWLRSRIAAYKLPRRIEFTPRLPREDSGKVMKRHLRDPYWKKAGRRI